MQATCRADSLLMCVLSLFDCRDVEELKKKITGEL
jgi:hypothetical protein